MPRREDPPKTSEPATRRSRVDAWEAVVRQELAKARRRRSPRFLADRRIERVVPGLGDPRPAEPPKDPA